MTYFKTVSYYDDNIIQIENSAAPIKGKSILLQHEKRNLERVNAVHTKILTYAIDEAKGLVLGEMDIRFDSKNSGQKRLEEAFVQHWENDKIVYQRFYYKEIQEDF